MRRRRRGRRRRRRRRRFNVGPVLVHNNPPALYSFSPDPLALSMRYPPTATRALTFTSGGGAAAAG